VWVSSKKHLILTPGSAFMHICSLTTTYLHGIPFSAYKKNIYIQRYRQHVLIPHSPSEQVSYNDFAFTLD